MNNYWKKIKVTSQWSIKCNTNGDRLVSKTHVSWKHIWPKSHTNTIKDIEFLTDILPEDISKYVYECLNEHTKIIEYLLLSWYEAEELFFKDFLSWPRNEISCNEMDILIDAFHDDRYELVPTILFANKNVENTADDIAETSSLVIEFHKRWMAF